MDMNPRRKKIRRKRDIHLEVSFNGLHESENKLISKAFKNIHGKQDDVQAKMIALVNLYNKNTNEHQKTSKFSSDVLINGLCGGWCKLFTKHPDWVESLYNAVRTWNPKKSSDVTLEHFTQHLNTKSQIKDPSNVIKLLHDVYDEMKWLEPEAGYDSPPEWTNIKIDPPAKSITYDDFVPMKEKEINLRNRQPAKFIIDQIQEITKKNSKGECMVHIESDLHHMALRVQKIPDKEVPHKLKTLITVVETEKSGITKTSSWNEAEKILDNYFRNDEPNVNSIILRSKTKGLDFL